MSRAEFAEFKEVAEAARLAALQERERPAREGKLAVSFSSKHQFFPLLAILLQSKHL